MYGIFTYNVISGICNASALAIKRTNISLFVYARLSITQDVLLRCFKQAGHRQGANNESTEPGYTLIIRRVQSVIHLLGNTHV